MKKIAITALLAVLAGQAWAVNKCTLPDGKVVYQEAACEGDATSKRMTILSNAATAEHSDRVQQMKTQCEEMLRNTPDWFDRNSLVFTGFMRGSVTTMKIGDQSVAVVEYLTKVNAKNRYGGYTGEKPAICYANMTETKILSIKTF